MAILRKGHKRRLGCLETDLETVLGVIQKKENVGNYYNKRDYVE